MRTSDATRLASLAAALSVATTVEAAESAATDGTAMGFRARAGGRYDNVRKCVATSPGTKGGPAADLSFFADVALRRGWSLDLDLPVFRPILFAASFDMLQFEPSVSLRRRQSSAGAVDLVFGPTLGVSLHHGPDHRSETKGPGRTASFFALGPIVGGYVGADFKRPAKTFNFQLGVTTYVIPLFSVDDPEHHQGIVVGGLLDASFRFHL